jgi:hypothetical protein
MGGAQVTLVCTAQRLRLPLTDMLNIALLLLPCCCCCRIAACAPCACLQVSGALTAQAGCILESLDNHVAGMFKGALTVGI